MRVNLLFGFLGSGKTTLARRLLKEGGGERKSRGVKRGNKVDGGRHGPDRDSVAALDLHRQVRRQFVERVLRWFARLPELLREVHAEHGIAASLRAAVFLFILFQLSENIFKTIIN